MNKTYIDLKTQVIAAGHTKCDSEWGGHGRKLINDAFNRLYWLHKGEAHIEHQGKNIHLEPGRLFVIPAHCSGKFYCETVMEQSWCHFNATIFNGLDFFEVFTVTPSAIIETGRQKYISGLWKEMLSSFKTDESFACKLKADSMLGVILSEFLQRINLDFIEDRISSIERFGPVLAYMENNIKSKIHVKTLASIIHLQENYFINIFAEHFRMGPIQYLNNMRIKRAREMLRTTALTIKEISGETGFNNEFYFSNTFKRIIGISPSEYRKDKDYFSA